MITTTNTFKNPYEHLPPAEVLRTTINVSLADSAFIRSLHGRPSALQNAVYLLLTKLINELKRANITSYDPAAFEHAVADCHVVLPGDIVGRTTSDAAANPVSDTPIETPNRDVGRGTPGVALPPRTTPLEPPDASRVPAGAGPRRRGKKAA